mgnify:CR=1 FL=1
MLKRALGFSGLAAAALLLAGCGDGSAGQAEAGSQETQSVTHAQGTTEIPANPSRVAVFDLSALDTLDALGVEVAGVAGDNFPPYLSKFQGNEYPKLGTLFEPDMEALNALRPDLAITGGRSSAKYQQVAGLVPTIDMRADNDAPIATAIANTRMLAGIFGKTEEAEERIARLEQSIEQLRSKTANGGRGLVVLTTGGRMSAYGPGSRFGVIHTDFGVPTAADGLDTSLHGEAIGSEFIRERNPDWLFVIDRDAAIGQGDAARRLLDNALVRQTNAWQRGQVVYLDPVPWYLVGSGIQSTQAMVDEITRAYDGAGNPPAEGQ